jgi:hypothetical protein
MMRACKGYLIAAQTFRVTCAVEVFVVMANGGRGFDEIRHAGEHTRAALGMKLHDGALLRGKRTGFHQDAIGCADASDVVQESGERKLFKVIGIEIKAATDGCRVTARAARVPVCVLVFGIERVGDKAHKTARRLAQPLGQALGL